MTVHPYTADDFARGEDVVKELHGLRGYNAWAQRIAQAIAAERDRVLKFRYTGDNETLDSFDRLKPANEQAAK